MVSTVTVFSKVDFIRGGMPFIGVRATPLANSTITSGAPLTCLTRTATSYGKRPVTRLVARDIIRFMLKIARNPTTSGMMIRRMQNAL